MNIKKSKNNKLFFYQTSATQENKLCKKVNNKIQFEIKAFRITLLISHFISKFRNVAKLKIVLFLFY